jgi:hypothetical protein
MAKKAVVSQVFAVIRSYYEKRRLPQLSVFEMLNQLPQLMVDVTDFRIVVFRKVDEFLAGVLQLSQYPPTGGGPLALAFVGVVGQKAVRELVGGVIRAVGPEEIHKGEKRGFLIPPVKGLFELGNRSIGLTVCPYIDNPVVVESLRQAGLLRNDGIFAQPKGPVSVLSKAFRECYEIRMQAHVNGEHPVARGKHPGEKRPMAWDGPAACRGRVAVRARRTLKFFEGRRCGSMMPVRREVVPSHGIQDNNHYVGSIFLCPNLFSGRFGRLLACQLERCSN